MNKLSEDLVFETLVEQTLSAMLHQILITLHCLHSRHRSARPSKKWSNYEYVNMDMFTRVNYTQHLSIM